MPMKVRYTVANGQILAEKRNGNYRFYRSDVLGSTVSLYDSNQTKTDSFTYWPYGETRTSSGSTGTKYKFVGGFGYREQADGAVYVRARTYRPKDTRWSTLDPVWPDWPAYQYAAAMPTVFIDPSGLFHQFVETPPKTVPGISPPGTGPKPGPGGGPIAIIIVGGIAIWDLTTWAFTGDEGPITGIGAEIGRACFPSPDSAPRNQADDCVEVYRQYKKECKGASCNKLSVPKDCAKIGEMLTKTMLCSWQRAWVINNCDSNPKAIDQGWIPKPTHPKALCDAIRAMCNCAAKARACGLPSIPREKCKGLIGACDQMGL